MVKVLNLYAGLGGNRKHWEGVEVTAVESNKSVAMFYKDHFPNDELIIGDAHQYLLENYNKFDFIWSSIPCPSHSRARFWASKPNKKVKPVFPDFKLYEEIFFLKHYFQGGYVVENVKPYYEPLTLPTINIGRHLFWSNFEIPNTDSNDANIHEGSIVNMQKHHGIDITGYKFDVRRDKLLRNCVHPELGKHIFNEYLKSCKNGQQPCI